MISTLWREEELKLHVSAWACSMEIELIYDWSDDNYFYSLIGYLLEIKDKGEKLFLKKMGDRYEKILEHKDGNEEPIHSLKILFETSETRISIIYEMDHCGEVSE